MKTSLINFIATDRRTVRERHVLGRNNYRPVLGACSLCAIIGIIVFFLPSALAASFGTDLGSFNGVTAYSNGSSGYYSGLSNTVNGIYTGIKWQCVEYVRRYYLIVYGSNLGSLYRGNANTWYDNASTMGLSRYANGGPTAPQVGDIITSNGGSFGHVAIIRSVTGNQVCTIQQNFSNDTNDLNRCLSLSVSSGTYTVGGFGGSYSIRGWLRKPGTTSPPACTGGFSDSYRVNGGPPLHPNGSLIIERNTNTVYVLQNGQRRPISSPDVLHHLYTGENGEFDFSDVIIVASDEMGRYPIGAGVFDSLPPNGRSQPDGRLIKQVGGGEISIVTDNGNRRPFSTESAFLGLGYQYCGVVEVSDYNSYTLGSVVVGLEALPTIISSITLTPSGPYAVGQNITASFSITNKGNTSTTFSQLLAGGRLNGSTVVDFPSDVNITLSPNQIYNYQRSRSFSSIGSYQFFPALQYQDGTFRISLNDEIGVSPGVVTVVSATINAGTRTLTGCILQSGQRSKHHG
jgi:surface antigen